MRLTVLAAAVLLTAGPALADGKPELVIYTYESFVSEWGPGPAIAANFEAICDCTVRFVGAGDGAALLGRLKLEGARTPADIVLGLDTNLTAQARADGLVQPHGLAVPADVGEGGLRRPIGRNLGGAEAARRHGGARLVRGLRPVPRR